MSMYGDMAAEAHYEYPKKTKSKDCGMCANCMTVKRWGAQYDEYLKTPHADKAWIRRERKLDRDVLICLRKLGIKE